MEKRVAAAAAAASGAAKAEAMKRAAADAKKAREIEIKVGTDDAKTAELSMRRQRWVPPRRSMSSRSAPRSSRAGDGDKLVEMSTDVKGTDEDEATKIAEKQAAVDAKQVEFDTAKSEKEFAEAMAVAPASSADAKKAAMKAAKTKALVEEQKSKELEAAKRELVEAKAAGVIVNAPPKADGGKGAIAVRDTVARRRRVKLGAKEMKLEMMEVRWDMQAPRTRGLLSSSLLRRAPFEKLHLSQQEVEMKSTDETADAIGVKKEQFVKLSRRRSRCAGLRPTPPPSTTSAWRRASSKKGRPTTATTRSSR